MRRSLAAVVPVALGALAIAGCGEEPSPEDRLSRSPGASADEGSAAFSVAMAMQMGRQQSGMRLTASGEGVFDFDARTGRMQLRVPGMASATEMILDRDHVYVRVPQAIAGGRGQWIRKPVPDSAKAARDAPWTADPSEIAEVLESDVGEISRLGTDTVRGTEVEGFGFTLRGDQLRPEHADTSAAPRELRNLEIPTEAWLDSGDRLRRLVAKFDLEPFLEAARSSMADSLGPSGGQALGGMLGALADTLTLTVELFDYGTAVDVRPPDSLEIVEPDELRRRMKSRRDSLGREAGGTLRGSGG